MANDFIQAMQRVVDARRRRFASPSDLEEAYSDFLGALARMSDPAEIAAALALDADELLLPPHLKSAAFERLLTLDGRRPRSLREYAWHLQLYGPDHDDEAAALLAEADEGEHRTS